MKKFLLLLPLICGACTSTPEPQSAAAAPAAGTSAAPPATAATGQVVDAQNGFRGRRFGEPISAFPTLQLLPRAEGPIQEYAMPYGKEDLQVGAARVKQIRYEFYEGKYFRTTITALGGEADKLLDEVRRVYGLGRETDKMQIWWEGQKVTATYQESWEGNKREANFYIWNNNLLARATPVPATEM